MRLKPDIRYVIEAAVLQNSTMMWPILSSSGLCSGGDAAKAGPVIARRRNNRAFRSDCIAAVSPPNRPAQYGHEGGSPTIGVTHLNHLTICTES